MFVGGHVGDVGVPDESDRVGDEEAVLKGHKVKVGKVDQRPHAVVVDENVKVDLHITDVMKKHRNKRANKG